MKNLIFERAAIGIYSDLDIFMCEVVIKTVVARHLLQRLHNSPTYLKRPPKAPSLQSVVATIYFALYLHALIVHPI